MKENDICPEPGSKVLFAAAIAFAERIKLKKRKVKISRAHRGYAARLDNGFIIIERKWYS